MTNSIVKVASITGLILLVPLIINTFWGSGVDGVGFNWTLSDFVIIGILLFVAGMLIEWARTIDGKGKRIFGVTAVVIGFLWLYAELAVGIFTNWGS